MCTEGPARDLRGGDWSPAISVVARIRFAVGSTVHCLSSLRHRPPDHRPMPQPDWKTCRADDAEGLQGTCEHHGPQAGSSSRLVAAAIARSSSEGQPLMALDCQPSLPRGAEELFCDSLRTQDLTGSTEAHLRVRSSYSCSLYARGRSRIYAVGLLTGRSNNPMCTRTETVTERRHAPY